MQLYVIRHCEATGQAVEAPLTDNGFQQADRLADFLKDTHIEQVICSPYLRARQSIQPYIERNGVPLVLDDRLSERVLSRSNLDNWLRCLKDTFQDFELSFDGGESSSQAMSRAVEVIRDIQSGEFKSVAVVTHGNLMTLLLKHFDERFGFDDWAHLTNPDVFRISLDKDSTMVERIWPDKN